MIQHEEKINKNIKNQRTNNRVEEQRNTRRQTMKIENTATKPTLRRPISEANHEEDKPRTALKKAKLHYGDE